MFEEKDELFDLGVGRSRDGAVILLESVAKTSTESRYLPADTPTAPLAVIAPRTPDHEYDVEHHGGLFYIRTNKSATNFRVMTAPVATPSEAQWTELVAHRPDVKIQRLDTFAGHLVLSEWEHGLQQLEIVDLKSRQRHRVSFAEPVYSASVGPNYVFGTSTLRYNYQSLVSPPAVFDYEITTRQATLVKRTEVPGGFDLRITSRSA